ncbi:MAG TPA: NAD-dependent epimerase/dehydratase family protein [Gemmatimonadales bacterium]|nr:NAD-dependent epimerase/dehydratase family protein [Gemmatimonadales bacterium]
MTASLESSDPSAPVAGPLLVTGVTGFTGGRLCERLVAAGHRVRALVRDPGRAERFARLGVELVVGDLRDPASLARAVAGVDTVYHIAALFRPGNATRQEMFAVNRDGTRHLLEAARAAGVRRFVHCSTIGVHGDVRQPPAAETAPYAPGDDYQASKAAGEQVALEFMRQGMPVVVVRPGGIYGPGDLRFLKLIRPVARGRFVMVGSGEILYQMVYIDDLVDGILRCGTTPDAVGNVYILTGEPAVTLNELVATIAGVVGVAPPRWRVPVAPLYLAAWLCELVCRPVGVNPPLFRRRVDFFRKTRSFDITKAKRELGFVPQTDLAAGLGRTVAWYREHGHL